MSPTKDPRTQLKVLIIEDHHDARTTMRMLLSLGYGHIVYEAADGTSGLRCALEQRPDVALIDLGLPDLDGKDVARGIRAHFDKREMLLIALTGYDSAEDQRLALEAGFDIHLVKPVTSSALQRILESLAQPGGET
jgi:CheY-like chemotaxis protein